MTKRSAFPLKVDIHDDSYSKQSATIFSVRNHFVEVLAIQVTLSVHLLIVYCSEPSKLRSVQLAACILMSQCAQYQYL